MNDPEASFGVSENRLSPLSPLHLWRGEAFRRSEAKVEASFEELNPLRLKRKLLSIDCILLMAVERTFP
jgi:hypothetical protein